MNIVKPTEEFARMSYSFYPWHKERCKAYGLGTYIRMRRPRHVCHKRQLSEGVSEKEGEGKG